MPSSNQINPFNYNIDDFDSGFLGPITDTNFRNYLFTHNLTTIDPSINNALGGNPWQDRGSEYNVSQSTFNVVDVPNLQDVAQIPSLYNNLTNPRQVNLTNNLQNLNPDVQNLLGQNTPIQAGLGQDATTLFNSNTSNIDLPSVQDAAQISSDINNFTEPRYDSLAKNPTPLELLTWYPVEFAAVYNQWAGDYDTSYGVPQTLKLGFAGNVESWVEPGGSVATATEIRNDELFSQVNNKWGPSEMIAYSYQADQVVSTNTGLIQYSTSVQSDFRDQLLTRSLGVGVIPFSTLGSGINFKPDGQNISDLDKIARKQRGVEVLNRVKTNFVDNTIGRLNTSPFGLLAGGNLIERNYTITVPKSSLGKAAEFIADLAGFNLPTSIIPDDAFTKIIQANGTEVDIPNSILDYTGAGQKSLLFDALYINKYSPKLGSDYNQPTTGSVLKNLAGAGQPPSKRNYLSDSQQPETSRVESLIDKLVGNNKTPSIPTEMENPSVGTVVAAGFYGSTEYPKGKSFSDDAGFDPVSGLEQDTEKPITTYIGSNGVVAFAANNTTNENFDWRYRENKFKKGLLKYTQELVNNSAKSSKFVVNIPNPITGENTPVVGISPSKMLKTTAGAIGYFDTDASLKDGTHITGVLSPSDPPTLPSKGNQARNIRISDTDPSGMEGGDLYCRSWTSRRKYYKGSNLIRNGGNWWKVNPEYANLMTLNWGEEPTGHPKIAWDSYDNAQWKKEHPDPSTLDSKTRGLLIPYMFSIENLAWKDAPQKVSLPKCELGPNGGRIMWFPPYDIDFSDNTSVSWDTTNFIGRGEPIYTYNHTERSGNLSWKIVVDHPEVLNSIRDKFIKNATRGSIPVDDGIIHSFFAGCDADTISKMFETVLPEETPPPTPIPVQKPVSVKPKDPPSPIKIYFENCRTEDGLYARPNGIGRAVNFEYEVTKSAIGGDWAGSLISDCSGYDALNLGVENKLKEMAKFLVTEDGKNYKIQIVGYTSASNPSAPFNQNLANDRASNTANYLYDLMVKEENGNPPKLGGTNLTYPAETSLKTNQNRWELGAKPLGGAVVSLCTPEKQCINPITNKKDCCDGNPCDQGGLEDGQANSSVSKSNRYASVKLVYEPSFQQALLDQQFKIEQNDAAKKEKEALDAYEKEKQERIKKIAAKYINECDYFTALEKDAPFVYKSIGEKIENFHPAFHAITPEGFNSRITFLQQCTRQGPQMLNDDQPQNMVFGRPPICVLRIGDFYHTKIVIDSMNFTFDPLQWDLNPEGIGVQPMIVKVDMGFKFVGGSSLGGPIKQLQNAVSYNFFANTGVYNPAKVLEKLKDQRSNFIYGAFLTPDQADLMYGPAKEDAVKVETPEIMAPPQNAEEAGSTEEQKTKVEEEANKNLKAEDINKQPNPNTEVKQGSIVINENGSITVTEINATPPKNKQFKATYNVYNKTKQPVIIQNVTIDCLSINFSKQPILPGKSGLIEFTLRENQVNAGFIQKTFNTTLSINNTAKTEKVKTTLKPK